MALLLLQQVWSLPLDFVWNTLVVGPIFKSGAARIVLAGADGRIHIYAQQKACGSCVPVLIYSRIGSAGFRH